MPMNFASEYSPGAPGGVCFVCKSARRAGETVVDFYVDPEELNWVGPTEIPGMAFELLAGSLEICSTCITEAARGLGMLSAEQATLLNQRKEQAEQRLVLAEIRADQAENALRGLLEYRESVQDTGNRVFGEETA
jgi:hypothetical protein